MTKGKFQLKIDEKITEQKLIENCLMYRYAGFDYRILLLFYGLGRRWHIDKFAYYYKMLAGAGIIKYGKKETEYQNQNSKILEIDKLTSEKKILKGL